MKARQKSWTEEETGVARRLLKDQAPDSEYERLLGRTKACARARIERLDRLSAPGPRRPEPKMFSVPVDVWIERSRRLAAPRSLTASIMGDPAPGYSALDRKRAHA
jgi:hypothetical protein